MKPSITNSKIHDLLHWIWLLKELIMDWQGFLKVSPILQEARNVWEALSGHEWTRQKVTSCPKHEIRKPTYKLCGTI
jgi:hypothetical protein